MTTFTLIFDHNAHDPQCSTDRDELFNNIYIDQHFADQRYILPFKIIQIDDDGVINNITPDYEVYAESRNDKRTLVL